MKTLLRLLLKTRPQTHRFQHDTRRVGGFTMIELLVGAIMAFLIITPLLGFVVSILEDDRKEGVKAITEDEIKTATDYIKDDLSQAIYIYDNEGITSLLGQGSPVIPTSANATPILVFLKRNLVENGIPFGTNTIADCPATDAKCDDTHVLSLVAYYLDTSTDSAFCPDDGGTCPARITRYEIHDGVKDISGTYLCGEEDQTPAVPDCPDPDQERSDGFPTSLNPNDMESLEAEDGPVPGYGNNARVLVSYIDTTANVPIATTCTDALNITDFPYPGGNEEDDRFADETTADAGMLVTTASNSFYACVDRFKTTAQINIRGNALRRLQADADYDPDQKSYFPTSSVTIKGLSQFGTN